jgi:hypothetical protein
MGTTFGALAVLLPVYGYWYGLLIFLAVIIVPFIITRNVALSMGTGLVALPFIAWLGMQSGPFVIWSIAIGIIIAIKFLPTARAAWAKAETKKDFIFGDRQRRKGNKT